MTSPDPGDHQDEPHAPDAGSTRTGSTRTGTGRTDQRPDARGDHSGRPGTGGARRPDGSREPDARRAPTGAVALLAGAAGLLLSFLTPPLGVALDVTAVVLGVRALRSRRREVSPAPRPSAGPAIAGIVLGGLGLLLVLLVAVTVWVLWPQVGAYLDCTRGANTVLARHQCAEVLRSSLEQRFGVPFPALSQLPGS